MPTRSPGFFANGSFALRLLSQGMTTKYGYDVVHGPAVYSDETKFHKIDFKKKPEQAARDMDRLFQIFQAHNIRFFFYAGDGNEPPHIHVERDDFEAKFWLDPVRLARMRGFGRKEIKRIRDLEIGRAHV